MPTSMNMVKGMPYIDNLDEVCDSCVFSKHHKASFAKEIKWKANKALELVHTNMCSPIKPMTTRHNKFFLTFIDDYSKKTYVYFLKRKSEVLNCFKDFKAIIEKQNDYNIKTMRYDRGG